MMIMKWSSFNTEGELSNFPYVCFAFTFEVKGGSLRHHMIYLSYYQFSICSLIVGCAGARSI